MNKDQTAVIPLESDPAVFDGFSRLLGLGPGYKFIDIYSIEDENLIAFLERPIIAIILLFPVQQGGNVAGDKAAPAPSADTQAPVWLKQNIRNACGPYALLHILTNYQDLLRKDDSPLREYCEKNKGNMNANIDKFIVDFATKYQSEFTENSGSSANPDPEAAIDLHFITYISKDHKLWELDGRATHQGPTYLGEASNVDASEEYVDLIDQPLIKQRILSYMNSVQDESSKLNFSLMGLAKSYD